MQGLLAMPESESYLLTLPSACETFRKRINLRDFLRGDSKFK